MIVSRGFLAVFGMASLFGSAEADTPEAGAMPAYADYVLVDKSERKLYLYRAGRVLREFDVTSRAITIGVPYSRASALLTGSAMRDGADESAL